TLPCCCRIKGDQRKMLEAQVRSGRTLRIRTPFAIESLELHPLLAHIQGDTDAAACQSEKGHVRRWHRDCLTDRKADGLVESRQPLRHGGREPKSRDCGKTCVQGRTQPRMLI